jgi:Domain of unknown function (DUF5060)
LIRKIFRTSAAFILTLLFSSCDSIPPSPNKLQFEPPLIPVRQGEILELLVRDSHAYKNPFIEASLETDFFAPDGRTLLRKGFYHSGDTWGVRFRPDQSGEWRYHHRFFSGSAMSATGEGGFRVLKSGSSGRIGRNAENQFRWVLDDGQPYFPIGLQTCIRGTEAQALEFIIDGEGRDDGSARRVSAQDYFSIYADAGFNLFRFSQRNCTYSIYDDLDHYNPENSLLTDKLLRVATANGFRVLFGFFGDHGDRNVGSQSERLLRLIRAKLRLIDESVSSVTDAATVDREKRFIDYCVARWGVYTDFWQLLNERKASDDWARLMATHVQTVDPDRKPVSISWEKPYLPEIGINTPHWYESEKEGESDLRTQQLSAQWKQFGKPVLVGEQGNTGMNWDPLSATRMRIRAWTALFQEIGLIFWNTSWSKYGIYQGSYRAGAAANIYLGPEERSYTKILHQFSTRLDSKVRMVPVVVSLPQDVRAYGLASSSVTVVYARHFTGDKDALSGLQVNVDLPSVSGLYYKWIDPATGSMLSEGSIRSRQSPIPAPPFKVDLALVVAQKP